MTEWGHLEYCEDEQKIEDHEVLAHSNIRDKMTIIWISTAGKLGTE